MGDLREFNGGKRGNRAMTTGRECVFVVSDLLQRSPGNKEWFSKTVFDGIAKKATEGDVAAVNWLVEHGFMSVVYFDEIIVVPAGVREAVERVREVGIADMTDGSQVVEKARKLGFEKEALWLKSTPAALVDGVVQGVDEDPDVEDDWA